MILMLVVIIACISLVGAGGILIACGVEKIGTTAVYMGAYTAAFTTIAIFVYVIVKTVLFSFLIFFKKSIDVFSYF